MENLTVFIVVQTILITLLLFFVYLVFKVKNSFDLEKRILRFSVFSITDKPLTLFEKIENKYNNFILKMSSGLSKSKVFSDYSKIFDKYFGKTRLIVESSVDVISNKFVFGIIAIFITIVSDSFRSISIEGTQILIAFLIGFFVPDIILYFGYKRVQKTIEEDFLKAVIIMSNAFKSGRSIMQAIEIVAKELDGVISDEFKRMYMDLSYGLDLEVVFDRLAKRTKLEETKYMASSLVIINKTGGDIVKVFSSIEHSFFERKKLNDELKSVTALSSLVFKILVSMPFFIFIMISVFNPLYFMPFISTGIGRVLLALILVIYVLYIVVVRKVIRIREW